MINMDSGIILNLENPEPNEIPKKEKKKKTFQKEKESPRETKVDRKRKYIDPKYFVPISSLFEKNPEIPAVKVDNQLTTKTKHITFSSDALEDLPINEKLKGNLKQQFMYNSLTQIQMLAIPPLLNGKDTMIKSPTGSGKTMCYAIPIVEKLSAFDPPIHRSDGPYAVILLPTRELALQIFTIFQELCKSCINIVPGLLVGGEKCKAEKGRLRKGVNILIATPGRLGYHLKETSCLNVSKVSWLVLDEVDRLLDMGFLSSVTEIIKELDTKGSDARQSVLLSATLNTHVDTLAKLSMKNPVIVDDAEKENDSFPEKKRKVQDTEFVLPDSLQQSYIFVPAKLRLVSLFAFLASKSFCGKDKNGSKIMVFMPNKASVQFYLELFKLVLKEEYNVTEKNCQQVLQLHGDQKQQDRFETFKKFKSLTNGILFCTDVAARGLDIKNVDWIVQFSCPQQIEDYCHKVGRTARIGMKGKSILFLLPSEKDFLNELSEQSIVLEECLLDSLLADALKSYGNKKMKTQEKATELQKFVEETIVKEKDYYKMAVSAHLAYIQSYSTYPTALKKIFHPRKLHLGHIAKSFALREAPGKLKVEVSKKDFKEIRKEKIEKVKLMKKKNKIPEDKIYSGPRPGKMNKVGKKNFKKGHKKKIRI